MNKIFFTLLSNILIASCVSAQTYTVEFSEDFFTYSTNTDWININIPGYMRSIEDEEGTWCEMGMEDYTYINIDIEPSDEFDYGYYTLPVCIYRVKIDSNYVLDKFSARVKKSEIIKRDIRVEGMAIPGCTKIAENSVPLLNYDGGIFPTQKQVTYVKREGDELIFYCSPFKYNSFTKTLKFISKIELDITMKQGEECSVFTNKETVNIEIDSDLQQTLYVYSSDGKMVLTTEFYRTLELDKGSFTPGVYIFKIVNGKGVAVRRVAI